MIGFSTNAYRGVVMNSVNRNFAKRILAAILLAITSVTVNAEVSKAAVIELYETNGFVCMDISQTINEDTLKSYTDLTSLEQTDVVNVCVKTDMKQAQISGNKFVFVFDQAGVLKTQNRIASVLD